ncbi:MULTISPECIES: ABC transporter substrate-binding protein [Parafrankia]|uniref:ABC transporter substrate-binding protein n=1 Tax=Parafrankia TaxID=2994362 RepID=UPI0034D40DCC
MSLLRRTAALLLVPALAVVAAGCGDDGGGDTAAASAPSVAAGFPVTVENCGVSTTYKAAPERVVAEEQNVIETMLTLDLTERIVGVATRNQTEPRADLAPAYRSLNVLSTRGGITRELLLSVDPELMVSRQEGSFAEEKGISRESLRGDGISSFVLGQDCIDGRPTWPGIYEQIQSLASVFGATEQADQVIAEMTATVEELETTAAERGTKPRVFIYDDSGEDVPGTQGEDALATMLLDSAGAENVFADVPGIFGNVTWEQLVERNPEVVMAIDYGDGSGFEAQPLIDRLRNHPAARNIDAVRNDRILIVPNQQLLLGVRNVEALRTIVENLGDRS